MIEVKNLFSKDIKMPKNAGWLLPGLQVKRWFAMIFFGSLLILLGAMIFFNMRPVFFTMEFIRYVAAAAPSKLVGIAVGIVGMGLFFKGWQKTNLSMLDLSTDRERGNILENLYRRRKLNRGPKIVVVGGGTGLSMLLKGIKKITNNITAIVTVGDDGGSSGRLREEMGVLPPGDIRNCIAALADDEDLVTKLFQYRFKTGEGLEGHSFGNLFLSALCSITGDMVRAVKESSNVLSIRGRVLPSTLDDMKLVAELEDGRIIKGESNIPQAHGRVKRLFTDPADCKPLEDVIHAIKEADLIILGPGSLYTSVIPNLLIKEISQEIINSSAHKIYVCNIMTQPGETDGYKVSDHINAIIAHAGKNIVDAVLVNNSLPDNLAEKYRLADSFPVKLDVDNVKKTGVRIVSKKLIEESKEGFVRHSSNRVARAIYHWYRKVPVSSKQGTVNREEETVKSK
ncbi:MAG: YvcK family protein [Candidatus Gastranaerophilales bacterium]|nr:YvcK family protein [Candidatus Gastranaerophilales bacterium]